MNDEANNEAWQQKQAHFIASGEKAELFSGMDAETVFLSRLKSYF